jgi:hypothetical protein
MVIFIMVILYCFNNNVNYLVDACFMHVIVIGANLILGLIKNG